MIKLIETQNTRCTLIRAVPFYLLIFMQSLPIVCWNFARIANRAASSQAAVRTCAFLSVSYLHCYILGFGPLTTLTVAFHLWAPHTTYLKRDPNRPYCAFSCLLFLITLTWARQWAGVGRFWLEVGFWEEMGFWSEFVQFLIGKTTFRTTKLDVFV